MFKISQRVQPEADTVIFYIIKNTPKHRLHDAAHDAILVDHFFLKLPESFKQQADISEKDVLEFIKTVDLEGLGIKDTGILRKKIMKLRNIDRIIDLIVGVLSEETKEKLVAEHLREIWFKKNSNGNLEHFLKNIKWDFWGIKPFEGFNIPAGPLL